MSERSGEIARIGMLVQALGGSKIDDRVSVGVEQLDDAAIVRISDDLELAIASDFVRGTEFYLFELGYLNFFDIGYYLIAANLSDIAAMGLLPAGLLTVIRYGPNVTDRDFKDVFRGMSAAADKYKVPIVGGDTGGYKADVFAATAFGVTKTGHYLTRSGAQAGDIVCLSGPIGGGIGSLTYFREVRPIRQVLSERRENELLDVWRRPRPRFDVGSLLLEEGLASACMDISDGLKASLEQLASLSRVGLLVREKSIVIHFGSEVSAGESGVDALTLASSASVDFELLFTIREGQIEDARSIFKDLGLTLIEIGEVQSGSGVRLLSSSGAEENFPGLAWDQQLGDHVKDILGLAFRRQRP